MKKIGLCFSDGKIDTVITCPERMVALQGGVDLTVIELSNEQESHNSYVDMATLTVQTKINFVFATSPNNSLIIANGNDEAIISDIPSGAQVQWPDGQTDIVNDGEIRFSVDLAGTYTFRFTAVPYLDKEITVEAIAAA